MKEQIVMLIAGIFGTVGFSILFGVRAKHLPFAALGGIIACAVYILTASLGVFISSTISAFVATLYGEIMARMRRAPVVTFLTPSIIVLVPGGALYYTVSNILSKNYVAASEYGLDTLDACLGIAAGIIVASLISNVIVGLIKKSKLKKENKK